MDVTREGDTELISKLMIKKVVTLQKQAIFVKLVSADKCKLI